MNKKKTLERLDVVLKNLNPDAGCIFDKVSGKVAIRAGFMHASQRFTWDEAYYLAYGKPPKDSDVPQAFKAGKTREEWLAEVTTETEDGLAAKKAYQELFGP